MATRLNVEYIPWNDFLLERFYWLQGEHVSLIGPTGGGKTTIALSLLHRRRLVVIIATKPRDDTVTDFMRKNREYKRIERWELRHELDKKVILWPPCRNPADMVKQSRVISSAISDIYAQGKWCIMADEVRYLTDNLRLKSWFDLLWLQARSLKVSVVACTQRPAWVPLEMYSQATHLFFWKDNDERNLRRIAGLGSVDPKLIIAEVRNLGRHEVLYVNSRTDELMRTRLDY